MGLSPGAIGMLIVGIILLYVIGLGLGIYLAWRGSRKKAQ